MSDRFSEAYQDLLTGSYDCVDRIVLNAYFRPGPSAGGFRVWWQKLTGSVETLDNAHLMRLSGGFSRRVRAWAKASGIPLIDCRPGERKHDIAEEHLKKTNVQQGVFLILVARAQAPVWDVSPKHRLERKKPMPYVNHYSFHILDPDWGHVTIKISGHPPFPSPGDPQRPRICGMPGKEGWNSIHERGKLLHANIWKDSRVWLPN